MAVFASSSFRSTLGVKMMRRLEITARDQTRLHVVHVLHSLRAQSEAHRAQSGQSHAVTLSGPRLDHLSGCIPAGLHHALTHAAAQGSLLDDLRLRQAGERYLPADSLSNFSSLSTAFTLSAIIAINFKGCKTFSYSLKPIP